MKTFYFIAIVIAFLFGQKSIAQQITDEPRCRKAYRHIILEESEKYFGNTNIIVDTFQYIIRPDFQCRYLDEDYLLCRIIQINDTFDIDELPFSVDFCRKYDVMVLDVNVLMMEYYRSRDYPFINAFFDEQFFREEYLGERNYGLFDYVDYIDSCVVDTSNRIKRLFLLVKNDEIPIVHSFQVRGEPLLCNINRIIKNQIYYSDIMHFKPNYNVKEFYSLSEWSSFLHHRVDKIIHSSNKKK